MNWNTKKRIILAGTPRFASNIFDEIINNFHVVAIICQPDKTSGRGNKIIYSDVKKIALMNNIPLYQPEKIKQIQQKIIDCRADLLLTCAYGQYIPVSILSIPRFMSVNIHASLLPRHRGAAPIHYSILSGDKYAGITLMNMTKEMDSGDIIFQEKLEINNKTTSDLFNELSSLAKLNIVDWLNKYFNNAYILKPQNNDYVTYSPKILKKESEIKNTDTIKKTLLKIQAFDKFPGTYINYKTQKLKIFKASRKPIDNSILFELSDGNIYIQEVQLPGKKRMQVDEFLRGQHNG